MKNERLLAETNASAVEIADELLSIEGSKVKLYAPHRRATEVLLDPAGVAIEPRGELDGWVSGSELTAILMIHNEVRNLQLTAQMGEEGKNYVTSLLEVGVMENLPEVVRGMADFLYYLPFAAGVRERVIREEKRPKGHSDSELARCLWWDNFAEAVRDDAWCLRTAVCRQTVAAVERLAELRNCSWRERGTGARLAAELYLAILAKMEAGL